MRGDQLQVGDLLMWGTSKKYLIYAVGGKHDNIVDVISHETQILMYVVSGGPLALTPWIHKVIRAGKVIYVR